MWDYKSLRHSTEECKYFKLKFYFKNGAKKVGLIKTGNLWKINGIILVLFATKYFVSRQDNFCCHCPFSSSRFHLSCCLRSLICFIWFQFCIQICLTSPILLNLFSLLHYCAPFAPPVCQEAHVPFMTCLLTDSCAAQLSVSLVWKILNSQN